MMVHKHNAELFLSIKLGFDESPIAAVDCWLRFHDSAQKVNVNIGLPYNQAFAFLGDGMVSENHKLIQAMVEAYIVKRFERESR